MRKTLLIISREYWTRVRKKSFVVMTILGPLMIALIYAVPIWLSKQTDEIKIIEVVDETGFFVFQIESNDKIEYKASLDLESSKEHLSAKEITAILHIPKREYTIPQNAFLLYTSEEPSMIVQADISTNLQSILRDRIMLDVLDISEQDVQMVKEAKMKLSSQNVMTGKSGFVEIKSGLGIILGILIYFFIFLFGSQVMRGVMEEKTNRIMEVMVSSVKPFQLMIGKIVGIALVGLTQVLLWILLSFFVIKGIQLSNPEIFKQLKNTEITSLPTKGIEATEMMQNTTNTQMSELLEGLTSIDFNVIIVTFLFFFIFGYLVYASLFAAIGSLIENETDSNQFVLPVTILMLVAMVMMPTIINNPNGTVAFWLSIIPFTSPVTMMVRIPFGVQYWEIAVSMLLLILTFFATTKLAAKIYRTGILMYGKKITYGEVWKWLKYKN